jgi:hypothetical protein
MDVHVLRLGDGDFLICGVIRRTIQQGEKDASGRPREFIPRGLSEHSGAGRPPQYEWNSLIYEEINKKRRIARF